MLRLSRVTGLLCVLAVSRMPAEAVPLGGRVLYGTGEPIADVQVVVRVLAGADRRHEYLRTDEDGRFAVPDVETGMVHIRVGGPEDAPFETNLDVRAEGSWTNLVLALPAGGLAGHVRDAAGQPVAAEAILLFDGTGEPMRILRTDEAGAFRCRGLADGEYTLACLPSEGKPAIARRRVTISGGRLVEGLLLEPGALSACGRVIDHEGEAITQAVVFVRALDEDLRAGGVRGQAVTDAEGRFCVSNLYASAYEVTVDARERGRLRRDRVLLQTSRDDLSIVLGGGAELAGRAVDAAGGPATGAYVQAVAPMESEVVSARAMTDAEGRFRLPRLRPGSYHVLARGPAGLSPWVVVEAVPSMPPREYDLPMSTSAGSSITGVVASAGRPAADAVVLLEHQWGLDLPSMAMADGQGRYAFTGLPGGSYTLRVAAGGRWLVRRLPLGDNAQVEMNLDVKRDPGL